MRKMQMREDKLYAALMAAGMPEVPGQFCVVPLYQTISRTTLAEIDTFIRVFDRVTTRPSWQQFVTADVPQLARSTRPETCFFSAWDFHLSPTQGWQLIEFNDNGSGLLFAGLINRLFYEVSGLEQTDAIEPPVEFSSLSDHVTHLVEREATAFFGKFPQGLFLILDDVESLQRGKFRRELRLLRDLFRRTGWKAEVSAPVQLQWDGQQLLWEEQAVSFIVNRSTDFLWQAAVFSGVATAYREGKVYVAPNPFTYTTRSDKRLLEFLSLPDWDESLGVQPEERALLSAHVPETHLLRPDNLDELAGRKEEFVFKPIHGFAGRGLLASVQIGRSRLQRLLKKGQGYVAQKKVPKSCLPTGQPDGVGLWTDLRVWAYQGERFCLSGRASARSDVLDLSPPGGWLPTYASRH